MLVRVAPRDASASAAEAEGRRLQTLENVYWIPPPHPDHPNRFFAGLPYRSLIIVATRAAGYGCRATV